MSHFRRLATGLFHAAALEQLKSIPPQVWVGVEAFRRIPLRGPPPGTQDEADERRCVDYPSLFAFVDLTRFLAQVMRQVLVLDDIRQLGRVALVKLAPGWAVPARGDDTGRYARAHDRYHLVLTGSPGFSFLAGEDPGETVNMLPGELWWLNYRVPNYAHNPGPDPQVHLVLDVRRPGVEDA